MKAGVLKGLDDIRFEEYKTPGITGDTDVKVKVKACGICKSDVPRVLNGTARYYPIILGHEFSGVVEAVGDKVTKVSVGDHVSGIPLVPCFDCDDCKKGDYSLCKNYSFIGSRRDGAYAEYVVVPEDNLVKVDEGVPFEAAALIETSTIALHGLYLAEFHKTPQDKRRVLVIGTGTVGMFALQWAKILGAEVIAILGRDDERLKVAKDIADCETINSTKDDIKESVDKITDGKGFDFVFDAVGIESTIKNSLEAVGNKGTICVIGTPTEDVRFSWEEWEVINRKELKLTGSWMSYSAPFPGREWEETVEHLKNGDLLMDDRLIYKTFDLSEIREAFDCFKNEKVKGRILLKMD